MQQLYANGLRESFHKTLHLCLAAAGEDCGFSLPGLFLSLLPGVSFL